LTSFWKFLEIEISAIREKERILNWFSLSMNTIWGAGHPGPKG